MNIKRLAKPISEQTCACKFKMLTKLGFVYLHVFYNVLVD